MTYNSSPDQLISGGLLSPTDINITTDPVHVSISTSANIPVTIQEPLRVNVENELGTGAKPVYGIFGELLVGNKYDSVSVQFHNGINYEYEATGGTYGDGSIIGTKSMAVISSTTGTACLRSKDAIAYRPGHTGYADFTASFLGNGHGEAGCCDCLDGFFVGKTSGTMCVGYKNSGTNTVVYEGEFKNPGLLADRDLTKPQIYRILFGYLGVADPVFQIWRDGHFKTFHQIETAGNIEWTHVGTPIFNVRCYTQGDMSIKTGSWGAGYFNGGLADVGDRFFTFPNIALVSGASAEPNEFTLNSTNVLTLAVFKNKDEYSTGKPNKSKATLTAYSFHTPIPSGTVYGDVIVQMIKNPVLTGTPTYNDINLESSIIQYDSTGTGATVSYSSGGRVALTEVVSYVGVNRSGSVQKSVPITAKHDLYLHPGETMAILAKDKAGNNVKVMPMFSWQEVH